MLNCPDAQRTCPVPTPAPTPPSVLVVAYGPAPQLWPVGLEICVPAGRSLPAGGLPDADRLYHVDSGSLRVGTGDGAMTAGPGESFVVRAGTAVRLDRTEDEPVRLILLLTPRLAGTRVTAAFPNGAANTRGQKPPE
jgi:hypothetical protein